MENEIAEECPVCGSDDVEINEDLPAQAFCHDCGYEGPVEQFGGD